MIKPEEFYRRDELLDGSRSKSIWRAIDDRIGGSRRAAAFIADRRSFVFGMAAAVLIYFTAVGVITTLRQVIEHSTPEAVRLDDAYRSAIEGFEKVIPSVVPATGGKAQEENYLASRRAQLVSVDAAIEALRKETSAGDLSPLKRKRLRELYSLKLSILQEMVENGDIEVL